MKNKLIYPLVVVMVAACGGDGDQTARQSQGEYETVQEGSASGVTSTISGPGETLPPITGTNADTTTAFALNPAAMPPAGAVPQQQAGTLAGTMPVPSYNPTQAPIARPAQVQQQAPRPMTSASPAPSPAPPTPRAEQPPPAQTETTESAPAPAEPSTDTTATPPSTNTAPPPAQKEQPAEEQEEEEEEQETPPPPPPGA